MLKNITVKCISKENAMKVRPHLGATNVNYINEELQKKPDSLILVWHQQYYKMELTRLRRSVTWLKRQCFLRGEFDPLQKT